MLPRDDQRAPDAACRKNVGWIYSLLSDPSFK
jgi:UDP-N-acetyl-D-mannosaminuronic acid transferase (WecB/TagA/CpsF family)